MHAYDAPRRQSLASVPAPVRPAQDSRSGHSATPIYDALYAEYVKSFRTLPGDRSGEEDWGFTAFGNIPHSTGAYRDHSPGLYGASLVRPAVEPPQWQRVGPVGRGTNEMHHVPAGLPPAPRSGV
ncbi:hypothetical protein ACH46L_27295 [Streptomyces althioticus]|uniref:hypothetical protein n=1 Tax=Streptomyces althioticus TaxID=83380 RepID=UPI003687E700